MAEAPFLRLRQGINARIIPPHYMYLSKQQVVSF